MIWSNPTDARRGFSNLTRSKQLHVTSLLVDSFVERGIPHQPVRYVEVPPMIHQIVKKLVIPYVHLDHNGFLLDSDPSFYAVTTRPDTSGRDKRSVTQRSQEAHVVAEDMALRRGIFTLYGRSNSEHLIANMIPDTYRDGYLDDRIAHLEALRTDANEHKDLLRASQHAELTRELKRGVSVLADLRAEL